jgi:hypothetical protein
MRLQAGKAYVVIAALAVMGMIGVSVGTAQDAPRKGPKVKSNVSSEDARQIDEDAQKQADLAGEAAAEAGQKAAQAAMDRARQIQLKIATPITTNLQFGDPNAAKIRKAAEELRDAKDDDAKTKATADLRDLLGTYFEEDMVHRQKELEGVEARLQKLHAQLERRRAKKQDIIDLQVKMSVNDADGLGFYSQPEGGAFNIVAPAPQAFTWNKGMFGGETISVPSADMMPPPPAEAHVPAVPPVPPAPPQAPHTTYKNIEPRND